MSQELKIYTQDSHVTTYRVELESGIISVKECIYVDQFFHVQLSYDGIPLPLPEYIRQSPFCKVRSLNMVTNPTLQVQTEYNFLKKYLPLPSETLLKNLKSK